MSSFSEYTDKDYVHPDDQTQPLEMTPEFQPFTRNIEFPPIYNAWYYVHLS